MGKKNIVALAAGIIVLMGLYPPFHIIAQTGVRLDKGYSFFWDPPGLASIDFGRLLLQWVMVAIILGALYYIQEKK